MRWELVAGKLLRPRYSRPIVLSWCAQDLTTTQRKINAPALLNAECMSCLRDQKLKLEQPKKVSSFPPKTRPATDTHLEDEMEFILDGGSREERSARSHLIENAPDPPHVYRGGILRGPKQNVRWTIPKGHHLIMWVFRKYAMTDLFQVKIETLTSLL